MNIPVLESYEDIAINTVASVINSAKNTLEGHQTLRELRETREALAGPALLSLAGLKRPLIPNGEAVIRDAIEKKWKLSAVLMYSLNYLGRANDDISDYYYYEVIFSQPTEQYPIPQATTTVYFYIREKHLQPAEQSGTPQIFFRVEYDNNEHDIRFVKLTPDWILGALQMKLKVWQRIENLNLF